MPNATTRPLVRILFVDDEANVLQGLQRTLHSRRKDWDMTFANGGRAALDLLDSETFDIVVTDLLMPEMNGVTLLQAVREAHPHITRIILSGHADEQMMKAAVDVAHQFLAKPCDSAQLKDVLARACYVKQFLAEPRLAELLGSIGNLPARPQIYTQLMQKLANPETTIHEISELVSEDIGITIKMLQVVNSAFFGLGHRVVACEQAAALLGVDLIRAIVLGIGTFQAFEIGAKSGLSEDVLYDHCYLTAGMAREIARTVGDPELLPEDAFLAGMLHDVGHLILAAYRPQEFRLVHERAEAEGCAFHVKELEVFGTTHAHVGAYLLGLWGLPLNVVEAVAFHHDWEAGPSANFTLAMCVHMANVMLNIHKAEASGVEAPLASSMAQQAKWTQRLGISEHYDTWLQFAAKLTGAPADAADAADAAPAAVRG